MSTLATALKPLRRRFYELGGPWYRCRLFEALGSRRYSEPALFGIDKRLAEIMPWNDGVFVEAGAHDGYTQSNTYYLERWRGWTGVLVEPVPQLRARCIRHRPQATVIEGALVGPDFSGESVELELGDLMSTTVSTANAELAANGRARSIEVPARTLSSILDDAGLTKIDLIALDLEGAELDAIAGLDLDRHQARYILVEALERDRQQPAVDAALAPQYEFLEAVSDYDLLYRRRP